MNIQHVTFMANCILLLRLQTCRPVLQCSLWVLLVLSVHCLVVEDQAQAAQSQPMSGVGSNTIAEIRVPVGFDVTQVAGDELVTNVFSLAVSPQGEIFVAGPGYIKVLIDSNGDQVFDSTRQFARGPESGAQGMCFDGADLLCTGDGGLLRFVDADDDGFADGPAEKMFSITTGGEHDAHAIRKGPDGWWYLLAGNGTKILPEYFSGKHSPVKNPRAGFLMRISPDWTEKEVFAHGFRNAYDFDFNTRGQVFVYDSDGERDISLPWYRPTRLFQIRAGDDAGWVTASWKRPSYFFDMPMEIGNLGRGSPTGVSNCQSKTFPSSYQDAVFVADWTFGRVVAFRRINSTGEYDRGTDFAIATGQFGFAVTDLDFAKDGSLLISAGGRGTKGAIYRVRYVGESDDRATPHRPAVEVDIKKGKLEFSSLIAALGDSDPAVRNVALESLVGREELMRSSKTDGAEFYSGLLGGLANAFQSASPQTLPLLIQIDRQLDVRLHEELAQMRLPIESQLALALRDSGIAAVEKAIAALSKGQGDPLVVARLGQLLLGGEDANSIPMFVGYSAKNPIELKRAQSTMVANELATAIARIGQRTDAERKSEILAEVGRLAAMLECSSPRLQKEMIALARVGSAQQSIHWLNCLSQTINDREKKLEPQFVAVVSETLAAVTKKIKRDNQDIDRNFYPRMKDLANRLCQRVGDEFSISLAKQLTGEAEEIYLVDVLPEKSRLVAVSKFADRIAADRENVTVNQLRVLLNSDAESCLRLLRTFADQKNLRSVVVEGISRSPIPTDQTLLAESLESFDPTTIKNSAIGLRRLGRSNDGNVLVSAVGQAARLVWDRPSTSVRDQLVLLMRNQTGKEFGYVRSQPGLNQAEALKRWEDFVESSYPKAFAQRSKRVADVNLDGLTERMARIKWDSGDEERGTAVYKNLQCAQCHDAGSRLGPRLEGISSRFDRDDVIRAIVAPNEQVPDRYRAVVIETVDGLIFQGSVVYESVDGITLQEPTGKTLRINRADIESRSVSKNSLMPEDLLSQSSDQDWADLYAFLKKL